MEGRTKSAACNRISQNITKYKVLRCGEENGKLTGKGRKTGQYCSLGEVTQPGKTRLSLQELRETTRKKRQTEEEVIKHKTSLTQNGEVGLIQNSFIS